MGIEGPTSSGTQGTSVADRLADLKARGSTVLVTGADAGEAHLDLCGRLFGDSPVEPRRRVLVVTSGAAELDARVPTGSEAVPETTVVPAATTRSAASAATTSQRAELVEPGGDSLGHLGVAITEAIERIEGHHAPLAAAELRVGLDSVSPLLDAHDEQRVFEFLAIATGYLRSLDALGHFHLPLDRDTYVSRLLAPLFDVVVEVRTRNGRPQHRWHLDDERVTTRWLQL